MGDGGQTKPKFSVKIVLGPGFHNSGGPGIIMMMFLMTAKIRMTMMMTYLINQR